MELIVDYASSMRKEEKIEISTLDGLMEFIRNLPDNDHWGRKIILRDNCNITVYDDYID